MPCLAQLTLAHSMVFLDDLIRLVPPQIYIKTSTDTVLVVLGGRSNSIFPRHLN